MVLFFLYRNVHDFKVKIVENGTISSLSHFSCLLFVTEFLIQSIVFIIWHSNCIQHLPSTGCEPRNYQKCKLSNNVQISCVISFFCMYASSGENCWILFYLIVSLCFLMFVKRCSSIALSLLPSTCLITN
jgi:hypothetical protein